MASNRTYMYGTIQGYEFTFEGWALSEIMGQCESFVNSKSLQQADKIVFSHNFADLRTLTNSSSWWKGSFEICQQIAQAIR